MRYVILFLIVAVAVAEISDESRMGEEKLEEPLDEYVKDRERRDVHDLGPYEENVRVKRSEHQIYRDRKKRSERAPQQVQKYDIYEKNQKSAVPSPPYEEILASSVKHYHMYQAPKAPEATRYMEVTPKPFVIIHPISDVQASDANPAYSKKNVPSVLVPVKQQVADLSAAADHLHKKHQRGHEGGGGRYYHKAYHSKYGGKGDNGYSLDHYVDKGKKGFKTDYKHRNEYEEAAGKKKKHHDRANHKASKKEEEAQENHGAKFAEKKGHKKRHKTKGYYNKYHKGELQKEHNFYDDFHKSGEHHRYGNFNAKHASNERSKKKAHRVDAGHDVTERGKKGYSIKGHVGSEDKGQKDKSGYEEYYEKHFQNGKKNGNGGSHWGYSKN